MKKETKDTWIFYGSLVIVCAFTVLAVTVWYIVKTWRFIKKIFKKKETLL